MKKILALMLSVMMVVCMMPSMAFAEGEGEQTSKPTQIELTSSNTTITLSAEKVTYTGASQKPTVTVTYTDGSSSTKLKENTDYTVSYKRGQDDETAFKNAGRDNSEETWHTPRLTLEEWEELYGGE